MIFYKAVNSKNGFLHIAWSTYQGSAYEINLFHSILQIDNLTLWFELSNRTLKCFVFVIFIYIIFNLQIYNLSIFVNFINIWNFKKIVLSLWLFSIFFVRELKYIKFHPVEFLHLCKPNDRKDSKKQGKNGYFIIIRMAAKIGKKI